MSVASNVAVTGNVLVKTGPCTLYGFYFPNAATIYDGTTAGGKVVAATAAAGMLSIPNGIALTTGCYVAAGAGAGSVWIG